MIKEEGNEYIVKLEALGLGKNDIDIEVKNGELLISSDRYEFGRYNKTIYLTDDIDLEKISANCVNGVLTMRLPKKLGYSRKIRIE